MSNGNYTKNLNHTILETHVVDGNFKQNRTFVTSGPMFKAVEDSYFGILVYPLSIILVYIFLGLIGNSFVLYVFTVKWRRTKTSVFIITLAMLDILNCSVNMPIEVAILSRPISFDFDLFCKIARCLSYITTASYSFLLVAVAFDRYLMVCRPLKRMTLGKQYATRTCIGAVVVGVLTQWPSLFIYGNFVFYIPVSQPNMTAGNANISLFVQGKTCLVTNYYYYENPTLTYAFQGFLFLGHVLIFSTLTIVYIIIGKRLYISSHFDFENKEPRSNLFKHGIISAITGSVFCGNRRKSVSSENYHHRPRISTVSDLIYPNSRLSNVSDISCKAPEERNKKEHINGHGTTKMQHEGNISKSLNDISTACAYSVSNHKVELLATNKVPCEKAESDFNKTVPLRSISSPSQCETNRTSIESGDSVFVRPLMPRSVSVDGAQMFSTCIDKTKKVDLKELSLKRNTLIMRMVTFTFMLSYLPFLIIVTLRYSNPDIPGKLSGAPLIVYHVFLRSYFFNSVTRPFIYAVMNKEYRNCVLQLLHIKR